MEVTGKTAKGP